MFLQEAKEICIKENQYTSALKNVGKRIGNTKIGKFTKGVGEDLHPFKKFIKPAAIGIGGTAAVAGTVNAINKGDEYRRKQAGKLMGGTVGAAGAILGGSAIANALRKRKCNKIEDKDKRQECLDKIS